MCETLFLALKKRIHSELVWEHNVHEQGGESCTLWQRGASEFVFFTRYYWGEQIKWNEVGWAGQVVRMIGKKCVQRNILIWKLERKTLEHRCNNIEVAVNGMQFEDVDWVHLARCVICEGGRAGVLWIWFWIFGHCERRELLIYQWEYYYLIKNFVSWRLLVTGR